MNLPLPLLHTPSLSDADEAELIKLYVRGTPAATLRAYERDLLYITAWKRAVFEDDLAWPEEEAVALRFVLDHARDLETAAADDRGRIAAEAMIAMKLRRRLACPASSTLDRRIASWRAFHRMRNLSSPFETPLLRQVRAKARRANARRTRPKSAKPITRDIVEDLVKAIGPGSRGLRDVAVILTGWASGGRRRSELANLRRENLNLSEFAEIGLVRMNLSSTKTTSKGETPGLALTGRAAQALVAWIDAADIREGPVFRAISKSGRILDRGLSPDGISHILRTRLEQAGFPKGFASAHGLRSGFLTQAALDGTPIQAAMRLSLHRSMAQAQRYYADVDIAENPALNLLE
jgi:integrase